MATMKILLAMASIAVLPLSFASPPDVTFLCNRMPEACTNMCWAVRCAHPTFPQTLTWDDPSGTVQDKRRTSAGCAPGGNKCGTNKKGVGHRGPPNISCDEYPFATTSESTYPNGHQVSRCIPIQQNSRQGSALKAAYKRFRDQGLHTHSLKINFGNPGSAGVKYCLNQACNNDGFEVQDKALSKREEAIPTFKYYRTSTGMIIGSLDENEIASNFTREVDDDEELAPHFNAWWDNIDGENMRLVTDTILHECHSNGTMK